MKPIINKQEKCLKANFRLAYYRLSVKRRSWIILEM